MQCTTVSLDDGGLSAFPRMQQRIHHARRCLASLPTLMLKSASYSASCAPSCSWQLAGFGTVWFKPLLMLFHTVFTCREALVSTGMGRWSDGVKRKYVIHYRKWTCKGRLRAKMQGNKKCNWQMIFFKVCVPLFFVKLLLWFEHNTSYSQKYTFYSRTYKCYHKQQKGQRCPGYVITLKVLRQGDGPRSSWQGLNIYLY